MGLMDYDPRSEGKKKKYAEFFFLKDQLPPQVKEGEIPCSEPLV